jgi:hypothetical protein
MVGSTCRRKAGHLSESVRLSARGLHVAIARLPAAGDAPAAAERLAAPTLAGKSAVQAGTRVERSIVEAIARDASRRLNGSSSGAAVGRLDARSSNASSSSATTSISRKLDVARRREAVARARDLRLLSGQARARDRA